MVRKYNKTGIRHKYNSYEYRRAYYNLFEKPFLNVKSNWIEGRYLCVFCGFFRRLNCFQRIKTPKIKIIASGRPKFVWQDLDLNNANHLSIHKSYIKTMIRLSRQFLAMYDEDYKDFLLAQHIDTKVASIKPSTFVSSVYQSQPIVTNNCNNQLSQPIVTTRITNIQTR